MIESKWERYAAAGGIAFVVLSLVALMFLGSPPKPTDSPREIADFYFHGRKAAGQGIPTTPVDDPGSGQMWHGGGMLRPDRGC